jgi:hypothetical protein
MLSDLLRGFRHLVQPDPIWLGEERRQLVRLHCHYRCIYAHRQQRLPGLVVDLGPQGVGLRPSRPLSVGEKVLIYCPFLELEGSFLPVLGEVRWSQGHPGGVGVLQSNEPALEGRTWLSAVLGVLGFDAQQMLHGRRWVRADCWMVGRLGEQPVEVVNLGVGGALLQSTQALEPAPCLSLGSHLSLPGKLQLARSEGLYGFEFDPLSGPQLQGLGRHLLALLGEAQKARLSGYAK